MENRLIRDDTLDAKIKEHLELDISHNLTDHDLKSLTELSIWNENIKTLHGIWAASNLNSLNLGDCGIIDISAIANLYGLTYLSLRHNAISDIAPLAGLFQLEILEIDNNSISDISPLSGLCNLKGCSLHNNPIKNYSPLAVAQGNRITLIDE